MGEPDQGDEWEEPNRIEVRDFDKAPFTFTWFYRALAVSDEPPPPTSPLYGQRRLDVTDRFLNLWICFNSILRDEYSESANDADLIRYVISDDAWLDHFGSVQSAEFRRNLRKLQRVSPIHDMKDDTRITHFDGESFEELIPFVYQVRNNLFHGRKNPDDIDPKDKQRIELSFLLLAPIIVEYLRETGQIQPRLQPDFEYQWAINGIPFEF